MNFQRHPFDRLIMRRREIKARIIRYHIYSSYQQHATYRLQKSRTEVAFWWTSIKEKPLELFLIQTTFQGNRTKSLKVLYADS